MICGKTIGAVLTETSRKYPHRAALVDEEHTYTYRQLDRLTDKLAGGLLGKGIRPGQHVAVLAGDSVNTLIHFYALWKLGAVVVPLCAAYLAGEIAERLREADADWLLCSGDGNAAGKPGLRTLPMGGDAELRRLCGPPCAPPEEVERRKGAVRPEDTDMILFTSGSGGAAKPVETTHFSRVHLMDLQAKLLHASEEDIFCASLPMHHCFSLTATILAAVSVGACVCFPADRHGVTLLETIQRRRCTVFNAVPTLFSVLLRRLEERPWDLSSLRIGLMGGSAYSPEFYMRVSEKLGCVILPSYGQTEATAGLTAASEEDPPELRARSVGRFLPGIQGSIRDPRSGVPLPPGEIGEICVRGCGVMKGYYRRPELTRQAIDPEGWLHTGDLGEMDEDGFLFYRGRWKELIIRGGENISPHEIETVLKSSPRIQAAKVVGLPDPHYIEEVCACVSGAPDITEEEVRNLAASRLARFKVPKYVLLLPKLPMTSTGKPDVAELKRMAVRHFGLADRPGPQEER